MRLIYREISLAPRMKQQGSSNAALFTVNYVYEHETTSASFSRLTVCHEDAPVTLHTIARDIFARESLIKVAQGFFLIDTDVLAYVRQPFREGTPPRQLFVVENGREL